MGGKIWHLGRGLMGVDRASVGQWFQLTSTVPDSRRTSTFNSLHVHAVKIQYIQWVIIGHHGEISLPFAFGASMIRSQRMATAAHVSERNVSVSMDGMRPVAW